MYLFQHGLAVWSDELNKNLHSTMYLFQQLRPWLITEEKTDLHSTMYLFQHAERRKRQKVERIYIPLCIYFNPDLQKPYIYYNNRCTSVDQADINYIYIDVFRQYLDYHR